MKVKDNLLLKSFGDKFIVVAVDEAADEFNGLITLNSTAAFVWKLLQNNTDYDDILNKLCDEYDADRALLKADLDALVSTLHSHNLLDE